MQLFYVHQRPIFLTLLLILSFDICNAQSICFMYDWALELACMYVWETHYKISVDIQIFITVYNLLDH